MNGDYSALAQAFQRQRPQNQPRPMGGGMMGGQNGGIVPPHMQQPRPMQQPMGGMGGAMQPRPMNPQLGMPRPPMGGPMPTMPGMAPRPASNGGIMGGQPQAPRPMQGMMTAPRAALR